MLGSGTETSDRYDAMVLMDQSDTNMYSRWTIIHNITAVLSDTGVIIIIYCLRITFPYVYSSTYDIR